jgi:hypothetical protein
MTDHQPRYLCIEYWNDRDTDRISIWMVWIWRNIMIQTMMNYSTNSVCWLDSFGHYCILSSQQHINKQDITMYHQHAHLGQLWSSLGSWCGISGYAILFVSRNILWRSLVQFCRTSILWYHWSMHYSSLAMNITNIWSQILLHYYTKYSILDDGIWIRSYANSMWYLNTTNQHALSTLLCTSTYEDKQIDVNINSR